jgi:hypothetical protein
MAAAEQPHLTLTRIVPQRSPCDHAWFYPIGGYRANPSHFGAPIKSWDCDEIAKYWQAFVIPFAREKHTLMRS